MARDVMSGINDQLIGVAFVYISNAFLNFLQHFGTLSLKTVFERGTFSFLKKF
jgi:hypothetical protein